MSGLKISELTQPSLSSNKNVRLTDLLPIARASLTGVDTFALPGAAFTNNLASVGLGTSLVGAKTFDPSVGNTIAIKSLSANVPIILVDDGNTLTFNLSSSALAGLTPVKSTFTGTGGQTSFNLPVVALPTDPSAYRVDINGVVQEPGVDYVVIATSNPFQIRFTTAPALNEKIVVVAFAPSVTGANTPPILSPQSVLGNPNDFSATGISVSVGTNQILANPSGSGLTGLTVGTNQLLANVGSGLAAVTLSAGSNISLNSSGSTLRIDAGINSPFHFLGTNNSGGEGSLGYFYLANSVNPTAYYKIATLPASILGTYDSVLIAGIFNDGWGASGTKKFDIILGNRSGFSYNFNTDVKAVGAGIIAQTESDGSVSVYAITKTGYYSYISFNIQTSTNAIIYTSPVSQSSVTGITVFDSTVNNPNYNSLSAPAGVITAYAGPTPPTGWLSCNGSGLSTTTYTNLFAAIGYTHGGSGGTFNIPDLRGYFIRGLGGGSGALGVNQDPSVGYFQWLCYSDDGDAQSGQQRSVRTVYFNGGLAANNGSGGPVNVYINPIDTRPYNKAMLYCIKY